MHLKISVSFDNFKIVSKKKKMLNLTYILFYLIISKLLLYFHLKHKFKPYNTFKNNIKYI